jgi:hypothetical protein
VLVLELDLHGFRALSDEVLVLPAPVTHARAPLLTVDFGTPSYEFTVNICTYLIF